MHLTPLPLLLMMSMSLSIVATASHTTARTAISSRDHGARPSISWSLSMSSSEASETPQSCSFGETAPKDLRSVLVMNVTRETDGDLVEIPCRGGCEDLCRTLGGVRIRCDLRDWPCKCKCASGNTFRTDSAKCVDYFSDCNHPRHDHQHRKPGVPLLTVPSPTITPSSPSILDLHSLPSSSSNSALSTSSTASSSTSLSTSSSSNFSSSITASVTKARKTSLQRICGITQAYHTSDYADRKDDIAMNIATLPWQLRYTVAQHSISIEWTNTTGAERLKGSIVKIHYNCFHHAHTSSCFAFKIAGSRNYAVAIDVLRRTQTTPSAAGNRLGVGPTELGDIMTSLYNLSATPETTVELDDTTISMTTEDAMTAYEERLEVIVTGLCVGVAILLLLWLGCFLIEKRSQSKYMKRGTDKQNVSQTRQYPHDVATVRKTLMEIYDMPMIKVATSDDDGSENGAASLASGQRGRNRISDPEGEDRSGSTNASSSDQPNGCDSSSSEDTLRQTGAKKKTVTLAEPAVHLDVPPKDAPPEKFGQWRPVHKTAGSPGEVRSNRFIKTSPPAHGKRLGGGILKKPGNIHSNKSPPSILRFSRGRRKSRDESVTIEMNSLGDHHHGQSPKKQMKLVSALKTVDAKRQKRTRFKMDEPEEANASNCAGAEDAAESEKAPQHLVTCEVHVETPDQVTVNGDLDNDHTDDDFEEEATERTPLKKNVDFVVVDKGLASKCQFNLSWEDTAGLPCTDV